ncbi:adenylosuccinate synthetase [Thermosporothrix hazakensis]|jgi:adenylosuccinate synthase|uniref:Adenylosuccinate synthetase n=2 Tax=Thermosporothrix TaxID=768650 RepID=A0A326U8L2_THEHA|nr:adenylosuccinate synthase [Thermosporothrix hazakensis]PZW32071.1 adenylosuccinate synthetase [Thermosporothrix hazakensis]BBH91456.1 adenylosuccinate synthetase [Thermosporothrix sp. COM3]GCE49601.1 adenylosuccinate synthetase [Thermosporothrix hazakensis]
MTVTVVVGTQWGDEGKGKLVDLLSADAQLCMRFQGGGNAGHTVVNRFGEFKLHLVPSGVFNSTCSCILGTGTVIDPPALLEELQEIAAQGVPIDHVLISDRAHVVMPYHKLLDKVEDEARGAYRVGTTGRGIGPAYTDKVARIGIRIGDLFYENVLRDKLAIILRRHNTILTHVYGQQPFDAEQLISACLEWGEQLRPRIVDTVPLVRTALREGKNILLEGQLSAMKDIDWGSYPFVTSSNPSSAGAAVGAGIPPYRIDRVIGVAKAYSSQVGTGPMPTELQGSEAEHLRQLGGEYGATTGRPRRVGWFDAVVTRFVTGLNGCTGLAITKLDVLDTFDEIPVCVAYRYQGEILQDLPDPFIHEQCEPVYEYLPGWKQDLSQVKSLQDLPRNARAYLDRLTELTEVPLHSVGVGPHREQTLLA